MDVRYGPRWWPVKGLYWLGWLIIANAVAFTLGLGIWVLARLLRM